jgi:hypothetical protein
MTIGTMRPSVRRRSPEARHRRRSPWILVPLAGAFPALVLGGCSKSASQSADAGPSSSSDASSPDATADASLDGGSDVNTDAGPALQLSLELHRADGGTPSPILASVTATNRSGQPVTGLDIAIEASGAQFPATGDGGTYQATIVPSFTSGELPLHVLVSGTDSGVSSTALVLPFVSDPWDQPQPVAGLVDTPGTEDSSTVSADGQWLIVATYSPVDIFCCSSGCGGFHAWDGNNGICSRVLGPTSGPARPGLPGADRIVSSTDIDFADPVMCASSPDGGPVYLPSDAGAYPLALPPVAVYGFHRQADGSYAEPFLIDTGSDGFIGQPFCLTFLDSGDAGDTAKVIFGYNVDSADGGLPHPWAGSVTLGETTSLGSYACNSATLPAYPAFTPHGIVPLPIGPPGQQAGNTSVAPASSGVYLLSDDESAQPPYTEFSFSDGGGSYTSWVPMALPDPTLDRRQPVAAGGRLYYYRTADIASVAWTGGDPSNAASFTDLEAELSSEANPTGRVGEVIAVGQPTFAVIQGKPQMFFVYYQRSATGFDGQIGTVPAR